MYNSGPNDYVACRVMTADRVTLVSCLFDGLLDVLRDARSALRSGDILGRSRALTRGIEILGELTASLDPAAEMSVRMSRLYEYMIWRLTEANIHQVEAPICEVERLAGEFAAVWRELAENGPVGTDRMVATPAQDTGVHVSLMG